jgi:phage I-like protein
MLYHLIAKIERNQSNGAPEWVLLFKAGKGRLDDGTEYLVDQKAFGFVTRKIEARGNEVHFDYEHASLTTQAAPAAGWIKELKWDQNLGIMARVEWTDQAAAYLAKKEYRYFSPVFYIQKYDHRVCDLDSVALTNRPKTHNLTPLVAKAGGHRQEDEMDKEKLIAALGLKKDATDAEICQAIAKIGVALPEEKTVETTVEKMPAEVIAALDLKDTDTASVAVASIEALKQTTKTQVSRADFTALQQKLADRDASDAVAAAMAKGKVTPDQKDWALAYAKKDLEGFGLYVAKAPQVVPVDDLPWGKPVKETREIDDATAQVAKMMDVDIEDIKKAAGK